MLSQEKSREKSDRFFNPWRVPLSEGAKAIVADVTNQLQDYESYYGKRKRLRKSSDQAIFEASVSAIICDLIHLELTGVGDGIAISRSNRVLGRRSRYRSPVLGKTLPHILDCMATIEMGFLLQQKGTENPFDGNKQTVIKPDTRLISRIKDHGLTLDGIGLSQSEKVIILRAKKRPGQERGDAVEYSDTEETDRYRAEMQQINEWLEQADINFDEGALEQDDIVDITKHSLLRIFNEGSFERGGRLFGDFWIELKKPERARGLTIDGEGVVTLDFGQMAPGFSMGSPKQHLQTVTFTISLGWSTGVKA